MTVTSSLYEVHERFILIPTHQWVRKQEPYTILDHNLIVNTLKKNGLPICTEKLITGSDSRITVLTFFGLFYCSFTSSAPCSCSSL